MSANGIWIAYVLSNAVAVLLLLVTWNRQRLARLLFALLFAGAAFVNSDLAFGHPAAYLDYAGYAIPPYAHFIRGWFAQHVQDVVLAIAAGQAVIACSMIAKGWFFRGGCLGGLLFLLAIAPLGIGSAFPFSLIAGAALWRLYRMGSDRYLWTNPYDPTYAPDRT